MTEGNGNVKGNLQDAERREGVVARRGEDRRLLSRIYDWFECHPKTIAWLSFWLFLNYIIDIVAGLWPF